MQLTTFALLVLSASVCLPTPVRAQGGVQNFCATGANGARLSASGSASFTANSGSGDLVLHAAPIAAGAPGLFFFTNALHQPLPFGQGYSCLGGTLNRLGVVFPAVGQSASLFALDYLDPASAAGIITPGSIWYFQFWFRSGGSFDLSDGLEIQFGAPVPVAGSSTIEQGSQSAHPLAHLNTGGVVLIENAADWIGFWGQHNTIFPSTQPPFVDFASDVVVAVFAGWRPSSGYSLSIQSLRLSIAALDVGTREATPGLGCGVLTVITYPYHFVRMPRVNALFVRDWTRAFHVGSCP